MAHNTLMRCVWIIDTLERYGAITRERLNELWLQSSHSEGKPLARRTFYNYRNEIANTFGIVVAYNSSTFEYYIDQEHSDIDRRQVQWLLDAMSISGMIRGSSDVSGRIVLENVPSARKFLPTVIDAMRENKRITFNYKSHKRVAATSGVTLEPFFIKIFRQVWYVIGRNVKDRRIKTYALDRMSALVITDTKFEMPEALEPHSFFKHCYGITASDEQPEKIMLRVEPTQANYLRATPLHNSQKEELHSQYSIFTYLMHNTYDLREKLLSMGSRIEVVAPKSLREQIEQELRQALKHYT